MEVVLRCKNDVCVGAVSVTFTMLYVKWFVLHFTVGVTRLLLPFVRILGCKTPGCWNIWL